jgi:hypothetical protein
MTAAEGRDEYGWPLPDEDRDPARWEERAARWTPGQIRENVPVQQGRAPLPADSWRKAGRRLETADTGDGELWRCREPRCRRFAGPYRNFLESREDASEHQRMAHPPQERQARASQSARPARQERAAR